MLTNYENLYDYCSNNTLTENPTIYHIGRKIGNYVLILGVDSKNNKMYKYSNEWLHLLTGLRHLLMDFKIGESLIAAKYSAIFVYIFWIITSLSMCLIVFL